MGLELKQRLLQTTKVQGGSGGRGGRQQAQTWSQLSAGATGSMLPPCRLLLGMHSTCSCCRAAGPAPLWRWEAPLASIAVQQTPITLPICRAITEMQICEGPS